ncbi:13189_t:CDS:2 [Dentiscutata erythropus]|uniref:13189_t:CDS:1 n=1 Tax=Dentiscutata erythropus TaxID=1348616 RepID=A0A9N9BW25_9GLOM|nr:13189_t:CDS:2 [Dentiscutata erythropus]
MPRFCFLKALYWKAKIRYHVQKKAEYDRLIDNFKKVLNFSNEDNDQKTLNELILSYIFEKKKKQDAESQIIVIQDQILTTDDD